MCICYLRIRDNEYGKNADQYLAMKCFLIEWLKDVLDGQHLSDCGKPNHSLGPVNKCFSCTAQVMLKKVSLCLHVSGTFNKQTGVFVGFQGIFYVGVLVS